MFFNQNRRAVGEVGIVCTFTMAWGWVPPLLGKMLTAITGIEQFADYAYLQQVGDRIINLERAFNVREGFDRQHDTLPRRMLNEPLLTRGAPGEGQMVRHLDKFLDQYYQIRGWTKEGIPSAEKLKKLNLSHVISDMNR
ncbi:aldehyde ferredoxin oxidoreductase C-terminal domain-containing protein [Chloroflexota bacterium]